MSTTDDLARRMATVCESAVSPLEIASALEFNGISDRAARESYGADDVFALARELYDRVPRRPAPAPDDDGPAPSRLRPLLHGALYALPAACFPAARPLLGGPGVLAALVTALLTGWGLSGGLAVVGYGRLGAGGPVQAGRVLRAGLACCLAAGALVMTVTALAAGSGPPAAAFGTGEIAYMVAAAVLLVTGSERWLLVALAPAVAGSAAYLILGEPPALTHLVWAALAATPVLACVLALTLQETRAPRGDRSHPALGYAGPGLAPSRVELTAALPALVFGVLAGGLLTLPVISGPAGTGGLNPGAVTAAVPLALSMGAAEWSLAWYRRTGQRLLRSSGEPGWFAARARRAAAGALGQYTAVLVALVAVALGVAVGSGQVTPGWPLFGAALGYALLGAGMFAALALQTVLVRAVPLAACALALAVEWALRGHGLVTQIAVPAALAAALAGYLLARAGDTTLHT